MRQFVKQCDVYTGHLQLGQLNVMVSLVVIVIVGRSTSSVVRTQQFFSQRQTLRLLDAQFRLDAGKPQTQFTQAGLEAKLQRARNGPCTASQRAVVSS